MYICENCFDSQSISNYIMQCGEKLDSYHCNSCECISEYRFEKNRLKEKVQSIIREHYEHDNDHGLVTSALIMAKDEDDDITSFIPSGLYNLRDICYQLFELDTINDKFYKLLEDYSRDVISEFDDDSYSENWMDIGCNWDGSKRILLDWNIFCERVKHSARFFDHEGYDRTKELSKLDNTFQTLSKKVSTTLYRARIINKESTYLDIENNPEEALGIAPSHKSGHNRFSPTGIPYVYLSEDNETILKEIRVSISDRVGIGKFGIDNLNLIDLRKKNLEKIINNPFDYRCTAELLCSFKTINAFLQDISKEVKKEVNHLEYIPTQIVSEYIWSLGYDGFIFDSSLCSGSNYVLFKNSYKFIDYTIE
ncbi:MAG: RES domain-containing protein [Aliarcobacter sp.]|jgi:hypothetical protein|nr:RES domain-containing protein [Aliarcobacter sp.]